MAERTQFYADLASNAFKDHVCRLEHPITGTVLESDAVFGVWECRNANGSNIYRFRVIHVPGLLWCGGDVGDCEWRRTYDMIAWARSAINSVDYFFEKVPQHIQKKEFSSDKARQWIKELDSDEFNETARELYSDLFSVTDNEYEFTDVLFNSDLHDGEMPPVYEWSSNLYWSRECIKWFLANCKELR